jgi:hypothetical protein
MRRRSGQFNIGGLQTKTLGTVRERQPEISIWHQLKHGDDSPSLSHESRSILFRNITQQPLRDVNYPDAIAGLNGSHVRQSPFQGKPLIARQVESRDSRLTASGFYGSAE